MRLQYANLNGTATYQAEVVFNSRQEPIHGLSSQPTEMQLIAQAAGSSVQVWPTAPMRYAVAPVPMNVTIIHIPQNLTKHGSLELSCHQRPGGAGNGRTCEIAEVLLRVTESSVSL